MNILMIFEMSCWHGVFKTFIKRCQILIRSRLRKVRRCDNLVLSTTASIFSWTPRMLLFWAETLLIKNIILRFNESMLYHMISDSDQIDVQIMWSPGHLGTFCVLDCLWLQGVYPPGTTRGALQMDTRNQRRCLKRQLEGECVGEERDEHEMLMIWYIYIRTCNRRYQHRTKAYSIFNKPSMCDQTMIPGDSILWSFRNLLFFVDGFWQTSPFLMLESLAKSDLMLLKTCGVPFEHVRNRPVSSSKIMKLSPMSKCSNVALSWKHKLNDPEEISLSLSLSIYLSISLYIYIYIHKHISKKHWVATHWVPNIWMTCWRPWKLMKHQAAIPSPACYPCWVSVGYPGVIRLSSFGDSKNANLWWLWFTLNGQCSVWVGKYDDPWPPWYPDIASWSRP